jgi:hypothetical protein
MLLDMQQRMVVSWRGEESGRKLFRGGVLWNLAVLETWKSGCTIPQDPA